MLRLRHRYRRLLSNQLRSMLIGQSDKENHLRHRRLLGHNLHHRRLQ
jgi:hypothetical protein